MIMQQSTQKTAVPVLGPAMFDRPPETWLPAVNRLLDEQQTLCESLERLGLEQSEYVASGRTDELLGILSRRQTLLDRIVEISTHLDPFRDRREALLARLPSQDRDGVKRRINAIADTVDRVRKRDDQDRRLLEEQRQIVADEISGISRLRGAAAAYAGAGSGARSIDAHGPRFHDRHG